MVINYKDAKLEKILKDESLIKRKYGNLALKIMIRMTELRSVRTLSEITHLPPPRRHKLEGYPNRFAVNISKNYRLIFESMDQSQTDPNDIDEIVIIGIEDYH